MYYRRTRVHVYYRRTHTHIHTVTFSLVHSIHTRAYQAVIQLPSSTYTTKTVNIFYVETQNWHEFASMNLYIVVLSIVNEETGIRLPKRKRSVKIRERECERKSDEDGCKIDTPNRHYPEQGRMSRFCFVRCSHRECGDFDSDELGSQHTDTHSYWNRALRCCVSIFIQYCFGRRKVLKLGLHVRTAFERLHAWIVVEHQEIKSKTTTTRLQTKSINIAAPY